MLCWHDTDVFLKKEQHNAEQGRDRRHLRWRNGHIFFLLSNEARRGNGALLYTGPIFLFWLYNSLLSQAHLESVVRARFSYFTFSLLAHSARGRVSSGTL